MDYKQYQLITDLIDSHKEKHLKEFRAALCMGARVKDLVEYSDNYIAFCEEAKEMLHSCIQEWVKNKYPENKELQRFWRVGKEKDE